MSDILVSADNLFYSCYASQPDTVRMCLEMGVDPNSRDVTNKTPIFYAEGKNAVDVLTILKDGGANFRLLDDKGRTCAFYCSSVEAIRTMFAYGADPNVIDEDGKTFADVGCREHGCVGLNDLVAEMMEGGMFIPLETNVQEVAELDYTPVIEYEETDNTEETEGYSTDEDFVESDLSDESPLDNSSIDRQTETPSIGNSPDTSGIDRQAAPSSFDMLSRILGSFHIKNNP